MLLTPGSANGFTLMSSHSSAPRRAIARDECCYVLIHAVVERRLPDLFDASAIALEHGQRRVPFVRRQQAVLPVRFASSIRHWFQSPNKFAGRFPGYRTLPIGAQAPPLRSTHTDDCSNRIRRANCPNRPKLKTVRTVL